MKKIAALIAVLLLSAPARAIELSLEENRGERGSVGYVDISRLFADSPDAVKAKQGFEDLVRQAEERVNLSKAELLRLRQDLDAARVQRDALATAMASAPAAPPVAAPRAAVAVASSTAAAVAVSTAGAVAVSTAAAAPAARPPLALPGMSNMPASAAPPSPAVSLSTRAAPGVPVVTSTGVAAAAALLFPPATTTPAAAAPPTQAQRLLDLDAKIIASESAIAHKEAEVTREHDDADRGLLDVESRKTDQVLARLYRAVSEVARREGVGVVIDKSAILYGHPAVDLTDKVLKYLKEAPAP